MRTAALPSFRKLWGRIDSGLLKGEYTILITNRKINYSFNDYKCLIQIFSPSSSSSCSSNMYLLIVEWGIFNYDSFIVLKNTEYPVDSFDGKKYFVLSTANAFGGRNSFLGIAYLVMGILCLIILAVFIYKKV